MRLNPADQTLRGKLAECLAKLGNRDEAHAEITKALASDPTDATLMYRAAIVSTTRGESSEAVQWLKRAVARGYPRTDIEREPEFALLRSSEEYGKALH